MTSCDLRQLLAKDVMTTTLQWATGEDSLRQAGERMAKHGLRALLVAGNRPEDLPGILTSKDIVNLVVAHDASILDQVQVADAMTRPAICVPESTNLHDCLALMRMTGVRRMPVLLNSKVVGILSMSDVFVHLLQKC
jgi:CBS domain-containing protein